MELSRSSRAAPAPGWKVSVTIPDDAPAGRTERVMVRYAVERMFREGKLFVSELRDLRGVLGRVDRPNASLDTMLHVLHCQDIRALPADVQEVLPTLVGDFLGIDVERVLEDPQLLPFRLIDASSVVGPAPETV
jgi:hypothetical protein